MSLVAAYAVPHPPLIIPEVGRGEEEGIAATVASYREVARRIAEHRPDTIIVSSPHAPAYYDTFAVCGSETLSGDMGRFRAPQVSLECTVDTEAVRAVCKTADDALIPCSERAWAGQPMDHATLIPLYFIEQCYTDYRLVVCGLSGLASHDHFVMGQILAYAVNQLGRRCVYVASGDWSHKLKPDGPYGFAPEGPYFDKRLADLFAADDLGGLFSLDPEMCEEAAECGLRSFQMMAGALDGVERTAEMLSYEGPFGVGYGVAAFESVDADRTPSSNED